MNSLITRTDVLNVLSALHGYQRYLEIGVDDGMNFAAVNCADKVGVDPAEGRYAGACPTHRMTSDEFFAQNTEKFDLIFIDGLHHADTAERDLRNALKCLNPGGAVVCHDLNPETEAMQRVPRLQQEWTGDVWKAWVTVRAENPDLAMAVIDTDYGVGVILPGYPAVGCPITEPLPKLTWANLCLHRGPWLNLMSVEDAHRWLSGANPEKVAASIGGKWPPGAQDVTVVTLWRPQWTEVQDRVFESLLAENFPAGTHLLWAVEEDSPSDLRLCEFISKLSEDDFQGCLLELITTDKQVAAKALDKHIVIANLYTHLLSQVRTSWTLIIEDDVMSPVGTVRKLLRHLSDWPTQGASIMVPYRSRARPQDVCASDLTRKYIPWEQVTSAPSTPLIPCRWTGGGYTMYPTEILQSGLPCSVEISAGGWILGWDVCLSHHFEKHGWIQYLDPSTTADHECQEVRRFFAAPQPT